jgi:3-oxoacyl-[acyl-carrier-protein] synthase III
MRRVYLTALAYELGEFYSIEEVDELKENPQVLKTLLMLGLDKYSRSNLATSEIAKNSALRTMEKAQFLGEDIDVLIYATNSFWDLEGSGLMEIGCLIDELDLKKAYPIGINLSECGNLQTGIRVATGLIKAESCTNILLITTDRISEKSSRIVPPNISVASDGAASFILTSSEIKGEFEVICTSQHMNAKVNSIDPIKQSLLFFEQIMEGVKKTSDMALVNIAKQPKDFRQLITNNYNMSVTKSICDSLGFNPMQAYTKNISRFAHASAADNVINLYDFSLENSVLTNELIMLIGTGTSAWGCTVLSKI